MKELKEKIEKMPIRTFKYIILSKFSSAHSLPGYIGPCSNIHGHTWHVRVEFEVRSDIIPDRGYFVDLIDLKNIVDSVCEELDHKYLNNIFSFAPTAENIAKHIFERLEKIVEIEFTTILRVVAVEVWESERAGVRYESD